MNEEQIQKESKFKKEAIMADCSTLLKFSKTLAVLFLGIFIASQTCNADQVVLEEGFESGIIDPAVWETGGTQTSISTINPHSGMYEVFLRGADWDGGQSFIRNAETFSEDNVIIDFWFRDLMLGEGSGGHKGHFAVYMYNSEGGYIGAVYQNKRFSEYLYIYFSNGVHTYSQTNLEALSAGWHRFTLAYKNDALSEITVYLDGNQIVKDTSSAKGSLGTVQLHVGGQYYNTSEIYLDDITISGVPATVPMATMEVKCFTAIDTHCGTQYDTIAGKGCLELAPEAAPFDPEVDDVVIAINDDAFTIPAGSFEEKSWWCFHWYSYSGCLPNVGYVVMCLNFQCHTWCLDIIGKDAAPLVAGDGANVSLTIGMNQGEDAFDWTKKWEGWKANVALFLD